jgi:hypothetical protein
MTKIETIEIEAEVVDHVRELARQRGGSLSDAIDAAVSEMLTQDKARPDTSSDIDLEKIDEIVQRFRLLPKIGPMPTDEDFYDANGLPL